MDPAALIPKIDIRVVSAGVGPLGNAVLNLEDMRDVGTAGGIPLHPDLSGEAGLRADWEIVEMGGCRVDGIRAGRCRDYGEGDGEGRGYGYQITPGPPGTKQAHVPVLSVGDGRFRASAGALSPGLRS